MAVSINGVSKKVSSSDTGTLQGVDSSSLLVEMDKEYKKLLKTLTEKTAESTKVTDELGYKIDAAYDILSKRSKEVSILTKRAEKTFNNLKNLSEEQQKVVLSSLKEDIASAFQSFEDVPKDLAEITNSLGKIKGSTDLRRTFEEISAISKKVQKIADQNQKAQERNLRISDSRKELLGSVGKWGTRTRDSLIESSFSMLGPLSPFLSSLYRTVGDNRDAFRRKREVKSPTEADLLKNGGNVGKASVFMTRELKRSLKGGFGKEDSFIDQLAQGVVTGFAGSSLGTALTGLSGVSLLKGGLGVALAIGVTSFLGVTAWEAFTKGFEQDKTDAKKAAEKIVADLKSSEKEISSGEATATGAVVAKEEYSRWDGLTEAISDFFRGVVPGGDSGNILEGIVGILSLGRTYQEEVVADTQQILKEAVSAQGLQNYGEAAFLYNYLIQQGRSDKARKFRDAILTPEYMEANFGGYVNTRNMPLSANPAVGAPDPRAFVQGVDDPLYQLLKNPYEEEGTGIFGLIKSLKPEYQQTGSALEEKYAQFLNDAIIYKDNSVYVPHPDDNIVLTKDDVGTSVLSESFEDTLLGLLREMVSRSTGNNVVIQESAMNFDFSSFRM